MLQFFKSNQPFIALVIPFICALLLLPIFWTEPEEFFTGSSVYALWMKKSWVLYLITLSSITAAGMMVNRFLIKSNLYTVKNFIPAFLYTLFMSVLVLWTGFQWVLIANIFLVLSLMHLFAFFSEISVLNAFFRSGFWLGMGIIFMPDFIFFLVAYLFILIQNRTFRIKEWLVLLIGAAFPLVYTFVLHFFFEDTFDLQIEWVFLISDYFKVVKEGDWLFKIDNIIAAITIALGLVFYFRSYRKNVKKTLIARNSFFYILIACVPVLGIYLVEDQCFGFLGIGIPMSCIMAFTFLDDEYTSLSSYLFNFMVLGLITTTILHNYF